MSVEWGNPNWGKPGHNVHESETGSWVADGHTASEGNES